MNNIVAAFQGMHVSPAKHSYVWLPRKSDYRTDTQAPDKVIPMCRYASQGTQKSTRTKYTSNHNQLVTCIATYLFYSYAMIVQDL